MSPLSMDINSPGSPSAEDSNSNTEREGEAPRTGRRGSRRQEKNRDAARRSRRKQTERADELHEELQNLERSNAAFQKEIAKLKKERLLYTEALEKHEPLCHLRDAATASISNSGTSSTACPMASPSVDPQSGPAKTPQAADHAEATTSSLSTSMTSTLRHQSLNCVQNKRISSKPPAAISTTLASSSLGKSKGLSVPVPYSGLFSTAPTAHSLFCDNPASLFTSVHQENGLVSKSLASSFLNMAAQAQPKADGRSSVSANSSISTFQAGDLDTFLTKQTSFGAASSNLEPSYSHSAAENASHLDGNPFNSMPFLQDPILQPLSNPELNPFQSDAPNPGLSLLSMLTNPSPLIVPQTTSNNFDVPLSEQLPGSDPPGDVSFSDLLEFNDWIL